MIYIITMKTILQIKLKPSDEQKTILLASMKRFNEACDYISAIAFKEKCFSKFSLHKIVYYDVKEKFGLTAQAVIRAIGKTVDSYKLHKKVQHSFRSTGAVVYDQRIMAFRGVDRVSLWTLEGRQVIPIVYGEYQKAKWFQRKGQADLVYKKGEFYLLVSVETEELPPIDPKGYIGVDLGIVEIASDSTGESFSGEVIESKRIRFAKLRKNLQACGSKSAKRHLQKVNKQETNFRRDINHCISKKIVEKAKRSRCGIVLEDLTNIRKRMKARKKQRSKMCSWSFAQLRQFLDYKAKMAGVPVVIVDPRNTSRRCSVCGYIDKRNRKNQAEFVCRSCGFMDNADFNASKNLSFLGFVNSQIVGTEIAKASCNCAIV